MRVAVVGASGNIGTALLRRLVDDATVTSIVGTARRPPTDAGPPYDRAEWATLDVSLPTAGAALTQVFDGVDAVVHLAWRLQSSHDPAYLERTNVGGSRAVVEAALKAGVPALVCASSFGAYAPSPDDQRRDESWPTTGLRTSLYSRQKAAVERILDEVEPDRMRIVRIRPGIVLQPAAASAMARNFLGPLVPTSLLRPSLVPVLPWPRGLRLQVAHADDVADAFARALHSDLSGGLNLATEPVVDRDLVAAVLQARAFEVPAGLVRGLAGAAWKARLQPTDPGLIDLARRGPLMDTSRARRELGWEPSRSAGEVLTEFLGALAKRRGGTTPVLQSRRFTGRSARD
jgi:UDP-glucose 4-epimerase